MNFNFQLDNKSSKAKYRQIVDSVIDEIGLGELKLGDRIPSLNQMTQTYQLSQDTVLSAYNELRSRGIISSAVGKGYFVAKTDINTGHKVFVLFDKMTAYKEILYESMMATAGKKTDLDIYFHHGNQKVFNSLISDAAGDYTAYVIVPIVSKATDQALEQLPLKKIFILDQGIERYGMKYRSVCQNFEKDIVRVLQNEQKQLNGFKRIRLVKNDQRQQFSEIERGFNTFCKQSGIRGEVLKSIEEYRI